MIPGTKNQLINAQVIVNENSDNTISIYWIDHKDSASAIGPEIKETKIPRDEWDAGVKNETKNLIQQMKETN